MSECLHCGCDIEKQYGEGSALCPHCQDARQQSATYDLRARLAEVEAENGRLRELARRVLRHNVESRWGICDAVDNDGRRYQSQALADDILNLRAALAQPKEPEHD